MPAIVPKSPPPPDWPADVSWPPTQDDLPYDDGMPMETLRHRLQMNLLIHPLEDYWQERTNLFVSGNMFIYFSLEQVKNQDFRGPDFFAVLNALPGRDRKSWVVWEEDKGPDVVIELLSQSTAEFDKEEKKLIYQDKLRVPEYYWFAPYGGERAGFALKEGVYQPIEPDEEGRLVSQVFGLALVDWEGVYKRHSAPWLRWATLDGQVLPTDEEMKAAAQGQAAQAQERAAQAQEQAAQAQQQAAQERHRAELLTAKLRELGIDPDSLK
ncbi:MAG: Uma2 family endonuclease [Acidobacteriota bacterium]